MGTEGDIGCSKHDVKYEDFDAVLLLVVLPTESISLTSVFEIKTLVNCCPDMLILEVLLTGGSGFRQLVKRREGVLC